MSHHRIMILIDSLTSGGAERVSANLSAWLARAGHEVTLVTMQGPERDFYTLSTDVRRVALELGGSGGLVLPFRRLLAIRQVIRTVRPHILVSMMTKASIYSILAGTGMGCLIVVSERNHPPMQKKDILTQLMRALTYRWAAGAVVLTAETEAWISKRLGVYRTAVIPPSVSLPLPSVQPILEPGSLVDLQDFVFLATGRLHPQKGFDLLIRAFAGLAGAAPRTRLVILGEGRERARLQAMILEHGLAGRVLLPGRSGNIAEWYQRADVFVFSSRYEGFGNSLLEAMAHARACISFDCEVGPRSIIRDGINGLLVEAESVSGLTSAMLRLWQDAGLRARLASQAAHVREIYAEPVVMARWESFFEQLSGQRLPEGGL